METLILNIPHFPRDVRPVRVTYQEFDDPAETNFWAKFRRTCSCTINARWVLGFLLVMSLFISGFVALFYRHFVLGFVIILMVPVGIIAVCCVLCCKSPECRAICCCCCSETAVESLPEERERLLPPSPVDEWSPVSSFDPMLSVERSLSRPSSAETSAIPSAKAQSLPEHLSVDDLPFANQSHVDEASVSERLSVKESQLETRDAPIPPEPIEDQYSPAIEEVPDDPEPTVTQIIFPDEPGQPIIEITLSLPDLEMIGEPHYLEPYSVAEFEALMAEGQSMDDPPLAIGPEPTLPEHDHASPLPTIEVPAVLQPSSEELPTFPEPSSGIETQALEHPPSVEAQTFTEQLGLDESPQSSHLEGSLIMDERPISDLLSVDESSLPNKDLPLISEPPIVNDLPLSNPSGVEITMTMDKKPVVEPLNVDEYPLPTGKAPTIIEPKAIDELPLPEQSRVEGTSAVVEVPIALPPSVDESSLPNGESPTPLEPSNEHMSHLPTAKALVILQSLRTELQKFSEPASGAETPRSTEETQAIEQPPSVRVLTVPDQQNINELPPLESSDVEASLTEVETSVAESFSVEESSLPTGNEPAIPELPIKNDSSLPKPSHGEGSLTVDEMPVDEPLVVDESPLPTGETVTLSSTPREDESPFPSEGATMISQPPCEELPTFLEPSSDELALSNRKAFAVPEPSSGDESPL